jgi:hypothetical protein
MSYVEEFEASKQEAARILDAADKARPPQFKVEGETLATYFWAIVRAASDLKQRMISKPGSPSPK